MRKLHEDALRCVLIAAAGAVLYERCKTASLQADASACAAIAARAARARQLSEGAIGSVVFIRTSVRRGLLVVLCVLLALR